MPVILTLKRLAKGKDLLAVASVAAALTNAGCQTTGNGTPANLQTIYDADDRLEPYDVEDPNALAVLPAVGALIDASNLYAVPDGAGAVLYLEDAKLCPGERFHADRRGAFCTMFMVSDRLALTAGHCIQDEEQCKHTAATFAFAKLEAGTAHSRQGVTTGGTDRGWALQPDEIFRCVRVAHRFQGFKWEPDFALIELDRDTGRTPITLAKSTVPSASKLFSWGHPLGLPLKFARGATSGSNGTRFFHDMDLFSGNSGSPIFNPKGEAVGLVTSAMTLDVYWQDIGRCYRSHAGSQHAASESATDLGAIHSQLAPHLP